MAKTNELQIKVFSSKKKVYKLYSTFSYTLAGFPVNKIIGVGAAVVPMKENCEYIFATNLFQ
jgi:hypothetical protein